MAAETDEIQEVDALPAKRRGPLGRLGCGLGLVVWALLILSPCFLISLAVWGEISLATGSAPEQRMRLWLIMDADQRGLGFSSAGVSEDDESLCVQTDVRFLLWHGSAEPVSYCQCYLQPDHSDAWVISETHGGECPP